MVLLNDLHTLLLRSFKRVLKNSRCIDLSSTPKDRNCFEIEMCKLAEKHLLENDLHSLLGLLDSHFHLALFIEWQALLSDALYFPLLREVMTVSHSSFCLEVFRRLLSPPKRDLQKRAELMMNGDEQDFLNALPLNIRIFRGAGQEKTEGFSWTLDEEVAKKFASRHVGNSVVIEGRCEKSKVIAYFATREESEILIDPLDVEIVKSTASFNNSSNSSLRSQMAKDAQHQLMNSSVFKRLLKEKA